MNKFVIEGKFWYAGDNAYIETKEKGENGLPTEINLVSFVKSHVVPFIKSHIEEESEITIVIELKRTMKE